MATEDQIALVTGAGQGIGRACALALATAGADVVAADIDGAAAEAVADEISKLGRRSLALQVDCGDVKEIDGMVAKSCETFGKIDVLVNNAGVTRRAYIMDLTEVDWDRIHRVNAKGVFFCLQAVARDMIRRKSGRIINMASIAGKGFAGSSNVIYAASKGAVISMTRLAAHQLGEHNINVNAVCPGVVKTAIYDEIVRVNAENAGISIEEMMERAVAAIPLRRANAPEDIADMVVFLASAGARNITGQSFNVDGGLVPD